METTVALRPCSTRTKKSGHERMNEKPYNLLDSIFNKFMIREKEMVLDYWTHERYPVFFRENETKNQTNDFSRIYYSIDQSIHEGSLLLSRNKVYLALNQQAVENNVFAHADIVRCNTMINMFDNGFEVSIPAYVGTLLSPFGDTGNVITTTSGDVEILTQDCKTSAFIKKSAIFTAMGSRFSVTNRIITDGVLHIYAKTEQGAGADIVVPPTYELELNLNGPYAIDSSAQLEAIPRRIDGEQSAVVKNATIIWESSNPDVVTISETGEASFIGEGEAEIVAIWREHNIAQTGLIQVLAETTPQCYIEYLGTAPVVKEGGGRRDFFAHFYDAAGNEDTTIVPVWSLEFLDPRQNGKVTIYAQNGMRLTLRGETGAPVYTIFNLWLTDSTGTYSAMLPIEIIGFMDAYP